MNRLQQSPCCIWFSILYRAFKNYSSILAQAQKLLLPPIFRSGQISAYTKAIYNVSQKSKHLLAKSNYKLYCMTSKPIVILFCLIVKVIIPRSCCPILTGHRFYLVRVIHKAYYNLKLLSSAVENPVHTANKWLMTLPITSLKRAFIFAVVWLKALMQRHIRAA